MTDITRIAARLHRINKLEKKLKEQKEDARGELFDYADSEQSEFLLPTTTIEIPQVFWQTTNISPDDFLASRFPTWELIAHDQDPIRYLDIFVLRKKREYMPWKWDDEDYSISKSPIEPTPEIDWDTLEAERPDLFDRLAKEVVSYEIDEEELNKILQEDPSVYEVLRRHSMFTRTTSQRVGVKTIE